MERLLAQEAHGRCVYCHCDAIDSLVVHHIRPWAADPRHEFEHLILLCGTCHGQADAGQIPQAQLYAIKSMLDSRRKVIGVPHGDRTIDKPDVVQVSHGKAAINVAAQTVTFRGYGKRRPPVPRIAGTVSDDPFKVGYLQYLAHRYNAFKAWEVGKATMNYTIIHSAYRREIGFAVKTTPLTLFDAAAAYLQGRVANTKLGRILAKRGNRLFETVAEFSPGTSDPAAGVPVTASGES